MKIEERNAKLAAAHARAAAENLTEQDIFTRLSEAENRHDEFVKIATWIRDNTSGVETEVFEYNLRNADTRYAIEQAMKSKRKHSFGVLTCNGEFGTM